MAKRKESKVAKPAKAPAAANGGADPEQADIDATRVAVEPAIARGISPHRMASACGAHPEDLKGFLEGRVSLTPALRARLRASVPSLLDALDPMKGGGD